MRELPPLGQRAARKRFLSSRVRHTAGHRRNPGRCSRTLGWNMTRLAKRLGRVSLATAALVAQVLPEAQLRVPAQPLVPAPLPQEAELPARVPPALPHLVVEAAVP